MSAGLSDYAKDAALNSLFGGTCYVGLCTTAPTGSSPNELTDTAYARVAVTFGSSSGGSVANTNQVVLGPYDADQTVVGAVVMDASTSGNMLAFGGLASSHVLHTADGDVYTFEIGDINVELTN